MTLFKERGVHALEWFFHVRLESQFSRRASFQFVSGSARLILSFGNHDSRSTKLTDGTLHPTASGIQPRMAARLKTAVPVSVRISLEIEGA